MPSFLKPQFWATPLLIAINLLVFVAMVATGTSVFEPSSAHLIAWGANASFQTLGGEYWRLLTACFIHIGLIHLATNMYSLYMMGGLLEAMIQPWRMLLLYLVCGLGGSVASIAYHENTVSAGASGAIFGIMGLLLGLLLSPLYPKPLRKAMLQQVFTIVGLNLLVGFSIPQIDNAAHVGGLITGFVLSGPLIWLLRPHTSPRRALLGTVGTAVLATMLLVGATVYIPNAYVQAQQALTTLINSEKTAQDAIEANEQKPKAAQQQSLVQVTLPAYRQGLAALEKVDAERLDAAMAAHLGRMKRYAKLRIAYYQLVAESYRKQVEPPTRQLDSLSIEMNELMEEMVRQQKLP